MKRILLFAVCMIAASLQLYSQCTTTNATSCTCKDGTTNCDLLPDIIVARPPLLVNGSSGYVEYPQVCTPSCSGNDGRLRVSVSTPNVGFGPLEVRSTTTAICGTDTFYNVASNFTCANGSPLKTILNQRVYHKTGNVMSFQDRYAGTMTYHPSHGHMHVDDWGVYTLRNATSDPNPLNWPVIGTGSKLAFCLMDYGSCSTYNGHCVDSANNTLINSNFPNYGLGGGNYGCSASVQGISSGYTDIYYQSLDGMWINLPPGLCNGTYWMVIQLDPYNYFMESNENNNVLAVQVNLTQQGGTTPFVTASGSTSFCQGGSVSLTATSGASYLWSNGATTQSITVTQSGNYSVTVSNGSNCSATSAPTAVNVSQIPVTAAASSNNICGGQNVSLSSTATSGGTYNVSTAFSNTNAFSIPDNNITGISSPINVSGIDPATINSSTIVSVRINITHTYTGDLIVQLVSPSQNTINLSNRRGGSGDNFTNTLFTANASIAISAGSAPFAGTYRPDGLFSALTGNVNGTWLLKVSDRAGTNIGTLNSWTLTLNDVTPTTLSYNWSSLPSGFSANTQNATASPTATTTYTVVATESGTGCTGSNSVTVNVGNNLNVTTNTPAGICAGQSATLTASGASSYVWSPATGLNTTNGGSVVASPAQTTTYMVIGTDGNCSDTSYVTLNVGPAPVISASAANSICQGGSTTLSANGATTYSWSPSTGLNSSTGSNVSASPTQTTVYTVTGTTNGCNSTAQVTVTVNPNPVVTVSSAASICSGQSANLSAGGADTYNWSPATGLNSTAGSSVIASPSSTTTYTVVGTTVDGCTGSSTVQIDVNPLPGSIASVTGTQHYCLPMNGFFTASAAANATTYTWTTPAGMTIASGQGTINASVTASATASGDVCVTASNACGSSAAVCRTVTAESTAPITPGTIAGVTKACPGETWPFSVTAVARASFYTWTLPAGTTLVSGAGTNAVNIQFNSSYNGGTISVVAGNGCGNSPARTKAMSLNTPIAPAIMNGNAAGVCNSIQTYSVTPVAGLTYNWTAPSNATILSGQGTSSVQIQFLPAFLSGNVSVTASNSCGTSTARVKAVKAVPAIPTSITGATSVCKGQTGVAYSTAPVYGATTYTWTIPSGTTLVSGQGTTNIVLNFALNAANSSLRVKAGNSCATSTNRTLNIAVNTCPKISDFTSKQQTGINLLPNPASTYVEVQFNSTSDARAELRINNILGQTVLKQFVTPENGFNNYMIDLRKMTKGVYVISILQDGKSYAQRLVIE